MASFGKAVGLGVLVWLVPFVVAFLVFPFRASARPLFESIMAVVVTSAGIGFGLVYLRGIRTAFVRECLLLGLLWLIISILIDAPLMLFGGPMKMSFTSYMADIGLTYPSIPVATLGLGLAAARGRAIGS